MRIALIVSRYHSFVTDRLESGARAALRAGGVPDRDVECIAVPGAFELAQAAARVAGASRVSAIVCLGCLIRGETPHFDYIARATADGLMRAAQQSGIPVGFGVLTTNTAEEALARAGDSTNNKGWEAAAAALEMATTYGRIDADAGRHRGKGTPLSNAGLRRGATGTPRGGRLGGGRGTPSSRKK